MLLKWSCYESISLGSFFSLFFFFVRTAKYSRAVEFHVVDRDFDKATAGKGIEGWVMYFAPNGSMLSDTSMP